MIEISGLRIYEVAVAFTDLLLCLESLLFAYLLLRRGKRLPGSVFLLLALSSLLGASFHAFFPLKDATPPGLLVWMLTVSCIGILASVLVALDLTLLKRGIGKIAWALAALFLGAYFYTTFFVGHGYPIVICFYAPPVVMLGVLSVIRFLRTKESGWLALATGVALSVLAALVQLFKVALDPNVLTFNTLYHVIQAVALYFLYRGFRRVL